MLLLTVTQYDQSEAPRHWTEAPELFSPTSHRPLSVNEVKWGDMPDRATEIHRLDSSTSESDEVHNDDDFFHSLREDIRKADEEADADDEAEEVTESAQDVIRRMRASHQDDVDQDTKASAPTFGMNSLARNHLPGLNFDRERMSLAGPEVEQNAERK